LATPKTKEEALRQMSRMWVAFVISIPLYVWAGEMKTGFTWLNFHNAGKTFVILAILSLIQFSWFRRKRYSSALALVRKQPENIDAVRRWMNSWIVLLCLAESVTVFGFFFRVGDKTLEQSLPFYAVGALLILWLWPRQVWPSAT
jgi:hypothetical protein